MKTKVYYLAIAMYAMLCAFTSCSTEKEQQINRYKNSFYDYVETDFDDVSNFDEITEVIVKDTIDPDFVLSIYDKMRKIGIYNALGKSEQATFDEIVSDVEQEVGIVGFNIKARIIQGGRKKIKMYYGAENLSSGEIKISDSKIDAEDKIVPVSYRRALRLVEEIKLKID